MKKMAKMDKSMGHSHSNSVLLEPNQKGEIVWKFENNNDFSVLINVATIISFIVAPIIAVFNFILVKRHLNEAYRPSLWLNILAILGIIYLTSFSVYFIFLNL